MPYNVRGVSSGLRYPVPSVVYFHGQMMRLLFWLSFALISYAYAGYPLLLSLAGRKRPVRKQYATPSVSLLIAARNEQSNIAAKLQSIQTFQYPAAQLQVIVVSDGSTDGTADLLLNAGTCVRPVILEHAVGKAEALNRGVAHATGDILVFSDARQTFDPEAVQELVSCFADPLVGAASGELMLETADGQPSSDGLGVYWKIEKMTRKLESETGSVVGVTGAIYAMRRHLFVPVPPGLLLDDVLIPMQVARSGHRVIFHPGAIARDRIFGETGKEFSRKVRTLTGNYQLLRLAPWLLSPTNPLLFRLISHKLLRLVVPLLLVLLLLSSALASGTFFKAVFVAQIFFYAIALVGYLAPAAREQRAVSVAYTFTMLNVAAAFAFYNFLGGRTRWA
ncbi:MAG: glycosyltransferase family 2 protein [Janthinobacterium lividum]